MMLFHATAVLATVALAERAIIHVGIGIVAGFGFVIAVALFAGDLTLRQYAGHGLFPYAAPTGGTLLIASWLALSVSAAWARRGGNVLSFSPFGGRWRGRSPRRMRGLCPRRETPRP